MKIYKRLKFIILFTAILNTSVFAQKELSADKIFDKVNNSVVVVLAYDGKGNLYQGSGIVINDEGYVVTNYHVCKDANKFEINHYKKAYKDAQIIKQDPDKDIAVLVVPNFPLTPIKIGSSDALKPGQRIYAIGSPEGYENSISEGIISGVRHDSNGNEVIQMTAPITEGSSGGAVVNSKGELVGMSMSGQHDGSIYFAVPVEDVLKLLDSKQIANTDNFSNNETDIEKLFEKGKDANADQKYEDAVFYFSKYLELNSGDNEAYYYRGYARLKLKDFKLAISDFTQAIASGSDDFEVYFYRGNAYYFTNDFQSALGDYTKAISLSPTLSELYYNRGYTNYKLKKFTAAVSDWEKAISLKPDYKQELDDLIKSIQETKPEQNSK
jgi:hypothetical protein